MVYCISCGNELKSGAKFCPRCGAKAPDDGGRADRAAALVERMQAGDNSAFDEFYAEFYKYVKFVAAQLVGSEAAEDVAQEVFLILYNKADTVRNPQAALAWLRQTTTNAAKNLLLKEKKYVLEDDGVDGDDRQSVFDTLEEDDSVLIPESALESGEMRSLIKGFISQLTPSQQVVLERTYFDGLKAKEISAETGMPESTVKTNLRRGKTQLKKNIEEYSKMTGQKLYSIPFAYLLWMLFRNMLLETAIPESMPGVLASAAAAASAAAGSSAHSTVGALTGGMAGETETAASATAGSSAHSTVGALTGGMAGEAETATAGGAAESAAGTAARTAAKAAGWSVKTKVAAGVIAAVVGVGGVGAVVTVMNRSAENAVVSEEESDADDDTEEPAAELAAEETEGSYVISSMYSYDADGNELWYRNYYYNDNWLLTGYITTYADGTTEERNYEYTFYDDGVTPMEKTYSYTSGDTYYTHVVSYDENGVESGKVIYNESDTWSGVRKYEYDDDGNLLKEEYEGYEDGILECASTTEYEYNDEGDLTREIYIWEADSIVYSYDEEGEYIGETVVEGGGNCTDVYEYEYNDNGDIEWERVEETTMDTYAKNEIFQWMEFTYDEDGNIVSWSSEDMSGSGQLYYISSSGYINWTWMSSADDNEYDGDGTYIGWYYLNSDGSVSWEIPHGYVFVWKHGSASLEDTWGDTYSEVEYDDHGNSIKVVEYDSDGGFLYWYEYEWVRTD